jgi:hypothetical protein
MKVFTQKSITEMPTTTFANSIEKWGVSIFVIDFRKHIFMSSDRSQNLQNKFLFNLRHARLSTTFRFKVMPQTEGKRNGITLCR